MRVSVILGLLGVFAASFAAQADELWSIGDRDGDYKELAVAGKHDEFSKAFPGDVVYTVGKSKSCSAWPYVHPGPSDAWAGTKSHTFKVEFKMRRVPNTACRLTLHFVSTHYAGAPFVEIAVNGATCGAAQLPRGNSDEAITNPKAGRACRQAFIISPELLQRGKNELTITNVSGSWMLYDSVKLEDGVPNEPDIVRVSAACTPMFKKVGDTMRQAVLVTVDNAGMPGCGVLSMAGESAAEQSFTIAQGTASYALLVPPFTKESQQTVTLKTAKRERAVSFDAKPEKQWIMYVAASAHTDIGYTDLQEKCMALHVDNACMGLDAATKSPEFKWNLEVFAQYDWFKDLKPERMEELNAKIKNRQVGLTALYLNMLTGLCSGGEMMHLLAPAQAAGRALGVPVEMASLNDVPSSIGTLPMFMRHAGVRYFAEAINQDRGPVFMHCDPEMNQSPFWWEAPDGSRVLTLLTQTYFQVHQIRLQESVAAVEETLPGFLNKFMRKDYPGDAIFINGAFLDNCAMTPRYEDVAKEWNAKWDFPKFVLTTPDEYFKHVEQKFGNDLPVYRGDMGSFWEDGAASTAAETGMVRGAKNILATAEKWSALERLRNPEAKPAPDHAGIWRDILYYDEHTWGSAVSISDPNNPQATGQWARKAAFATNALNKSQAAQETDGLTSLASLTGANAAADGKVVTVSNALSWTRNVPVTIPGADAAWKVKDLSSGKYVCAQKTADGGLYFVAKDVPAMGWRAYELVTADVCKGKALLEPAGDANTWATDRFVFHLNAQTGGIDRILDKETNREWVDKTSGYAMNQFLHVAGGNGTGMIHPGHKVATDLAHGTHSSATITLVENGPARAVLHVKSEGNVSPVDTDIIIHRDGTVDFVNVIHKIETLEKEAGYFVFPFNMNNPDLTTALVELPYGIVAVDQEQMPGACREWYSVNTFAAVDNGAQSACVAAADTPLFTVGTINRGIWPARNTGNRNMLYGYVYNNYWHTNYKASQGGDIRCAFSVKLSDAPFDPVDATQFGWARTLDLTLGAQNAVRSASAGAVAKQSLVELDNGPVLLSELVSLGGNRMLARLYNPSGTAAETGLAITGVKIRQTLKTDLFGEHGDIVPVGGKVRVPARGIATVVMQTK